MHAFRVNKYREKTRRNKVRKIERKRKKRLKQKGIRKKTNLVRGDERVHELFRRVRVTYKIKEGKENTPQASGLRQAAWRLRRSLPKDKTKRDAVLDEINRVEKVGPQRKLCYSQTNYCDIAQKVIAITKHCAKKNFDKVDRIATSIKKKYKSFRSAHRQFGALSWKRWHSICKPKKVLHLDRRITDKEKNEIVDLYLSEKVSVTLPFKRYAKKKFMVLTICQAYQMYVRMKKDSKSGRILSISSFYKLKPKHVKPRRCLPLNLCTCSACANFSLQRETLVTHNVKGITKRSTVAACLMLCPKENTANVETMYDLSTYNKDCLYQSCKECTTEKIKQKIKKENPTIDWSKTVTWHKWMNVKKVVNNKECSGYEKVMFNGQLDDLLDVYTSESRSMPLHLLNNEWQRNMYCTQRDRLQAGEVQMVIDYAKNYAHVSQNEPQSAHWDRKQSTLHPLALSFPCPETGCNETVMDEVVCITPDLNHDKYGVETFVEATLKMLEQSKVPITSVHEWCDNCGGQYKSRFAFELFSQSKYPRMRNFYGANHGKSAADGIIGRLKMKIECDVKVGAQIEDAEGLYNYLQKDLDREEKDIKSTGCQHLRKHFLYFPTIKMPKTKKDVKQIPGIKKIHSIRTTGKEGAIEVRRLTCYCYGCQRGSECRNKNIVDKWKIISFTEGKIFTNKHWNSAENKKQKSKVSVTKQRKQTVLKDVKFSLPKKMSRTSRPKRKVETWVEIGERLQRCKTYLALKEEVKKITLPIKVQENLTDLEIKNPTPDKISLDIYPHDAPQGYTPISVYGDGNCFTRSLSVLVYGNEEKHTELRARLCAEAVVHNEFYLDNDYLNLHGKFQADIAEYLAIVSESYSAVEHRNWNTVVVEQIYEHEALSLAKNGQYCSMWQLYQASNILGRPIMSIFPECMVEEYRSRSNRIVYPIRFYLRDLDPVCIMWMKCSRNARAPNHFVPVVKIEYV